VINYPVVTVAIVEQCLRLLSGSGWVDANLSDANLSDADLSPIRDDLRLVLTSAPVGGRRQEPVHIAGQRCVGKCSVCNRTKPRRTESSNQAKIMVALGCEHDFRVFRNNVGIATFGAAKVRYGLLPGSSDLIGILAPMGRLVSLEVKQEGKKPTPEQVAWLKMIRKMGGFAAVVTDVVDARDALERARAGLSE
jgi:hypothetical protein